MNAGDPLEWYMDIPVVSRAYLTLSFLTTAACALDLVSPFSLYFNYKLIVEKAQLWRLLSNFLFFGTFGIDFVFHMYFLCRYSRLLEENSFRGRTADFVWMLLLAAVAMTAIAPFVSVHFLGSSLTFMMVYVWGRRNRYERMSFLGLFPFTAPYLPWVLLSFSVLLGHTWIIDGIGMLVGHLYYYAEDVYPALADARGWKRRKLLVTPSLIHRLCGSTPPGQAARQEEADAAGPALVVQGEPVLEAAAVQAAAAAAAEAAQAAIPEAAHPDGAPRQGNAHHAADTPPNDGASAAAAAAVDGGAGAGPLASGGDGAQAVPAAGPGAAGEDIRDPNVGVGGSPHAAPQDAAVPAVG